MKYKHKARVQRSEIYLALENINYEWSSKELNKFMDLWMEGFSLKYICNLLDRDIDDAAVLIMDISSRRKLFPPRDHGIQISSPVEENPRYNHAKSLFFHDYPENYTALLEHSKINFIWDESEILMFETLWKQGASLQDICKKLKKHHLNVALLILDRKRKGHIEIREGGLKGSGLDATKGNGRKKNRNQSAAS